MAVVVLLSSTPLATRSLRLTSASISRPIAPLPPSSFRVPRELKLMSVTRCVALGDNNPTVYQGIYGPWSVDQSDVREVILCRSGLVTAAASFVIAASTAFLQENNSLKEFLKQDLNLLYSLGAGGLGLPFFLIHIYVTEIKRTLQALWAVGVLGSLVAYLNLAQPIGQSLPDYVVDNPTTVWFVGPLFAALTGLIFSKVQVFFWVFDRRGRRQP